MVLHGRIAEKDVAQAQKLRSEHRAVGVPEQFDKGGSVAGIKGDADAGRNADCERPDLAGCGYGCEQLVGDGRDLLSVLYVEQETHELVATVAADRVLRTDAVRQPRTDHLEQLVADRMTMGVVYRLEPVQIDVQEAELTGAGCMPCQHLGRDLLERMAIGKSGQRIVQRRVARVLSAGFAGQQMVLGKSQIEAG